MASQVAPNLESLGEDYQLLGELRGQGRRAYLAKRREDGTDALIVIVSRPEGDERNALSHLAADTKQLIDHKHRNLIRILDGRWVGDDFAVVTARVAAPTLRELLDRGEVLSTPRIAAILREVNGVLAWAREQKVVHRAVTPETLFLDPRTDRVLVSFTVRPIKVTGRGDGVEDDARTIGRLAWAMLARTSEPPETSEQSLADLRPDLPLRVVETTQALAAHEGDGAALPRVLDYIASIAMAEVIMLGELETAQVQAIMLDEQRQERIKFELEKNVCEEANRQQAKRLADEKKELERQIAAERAELAARREELERTTAKKVADVERDTAKRIADTERDATKRIADTERDAAKRIEETEKSFAKQKDELERSFAKRREELERAHAKQVDELERTHTRQTQELEKSFAKRSEELEKGFAKRSDELERTFTKRREELEGGTTKQRQELERMAAKQREELQAERQAAERALAKQREELLAERQSTERALAKQREELERAMAKERQELERRVAKEREEMEARRAAVERAFEEERARLAAERMQLEQERADVDAYWARTEQRLHEARIHPDDDERSVAAPEVGTAASLLADAAREREIARPVDRELPAATADASDDDGIPFAPAVLAFAADDRHEADRDDPTAAPVPDAKTPHDEEASSSRMSRSARRRQKREKWAAATAVPAKPIVAGERTMSDADADADPDVVAEADADAHSPAQPTWRDRARKVFGARWTIPGAGLALVAALGTAVALNDDDGSDTRESAAATVVDSAAGAVVARESAAPPAPAPVRSVVPMPIDYSTNTGGPEVEPPPAPPRTSGDERERPSRRPVAERPRPSSDGWRTRGAETPSATRALPAESPPTVPTTATATPTTSTTTDSAAAPPSPAALPPGFFARVWSSFTRPDTARRGIAARPRADSTRPDSLRR